MYRWQRAYLAGFFDGDGCIYGQVDPVYGQPFVKVQLGNSNLELMEWVREVTGVKKSLRRKDPRPSSTRYFYNLHLAGLEAAAFLRIMLPYLRGRKEEAVLALEVLEGPRKGDRRGLSWKEIRHFRTVRIRKIKEIQCSRLDLEADRLEGGDG